SCHLTQACGPTPLANSCNKPCVRQCRNSTVVLEPPPVVVALHGAILWSSTSAAIGNILSCEGVPIPSGSCDLSSISSHYCGTRCPPHCSHWRWLQGRNSKLMQATDFAEAENPGLPLRKQGRKGASLASLKTQPMSDLPVFHSLPFLSCLLLHWR
uniref:Keratin n=1 Tax=Dromaius novaehollandiae TaxID=8790 RepID=A0A8C4K832_DRONO